MVRVLALASCLLVTAVFASENDDPEPASPHVDLASKANHKLKADFGTGLYPGNNLAGLPTGLKTLGGVKFRVGGGLIHLGSDKAKAQKVEGVKVGKTVGKLHFLHGTERSAGNGVVIGKYVVHYADKTRAEIEVTYGKDVVDWWAYPNQAAPTVGKVAWEGRTSRPRASTPRSGCM